ncbi:hypothetical protein E2C01_078767 [Portunus trituberculatus]|uniref:Endonuclease/exonuclease/phosphatase domain-containing protein n=1 Tax=Portunus trituberculatus TaxID=210409 RepID=A0A5B7IJP6_PORTR|nr:hypothetical protein [Portunus trituberculatus]
MCVCVCVCNPPPHILNLVCTSQSLPTGHRSSPDRCSWARAHQCPQQGDPPKRYVPYVCPQRGSAMWGYEVRWALVLALIGVLDACLRSGHAITSSSVYKIRCRLNIAKSPSLHHLTSHQPPFAKISILGDFNIYHQLWHSSSFTDHPGELAFNFAILHDPE